MSFQDLGVQEAVVHGVQSLGFNEPTPIQERCIPLILQGKDVVGSAQTGTGKTAAFALPVLTLLRKARCGEMSGSGADAGTGNPGRDGVSVLRAFYGARDWRVLRRGRLRSPKESFELWDRRDCCYPGPAFGSAEQGVLKLDSIEILVLDEVDRMVDMGFLPDVRRIVQLCPKSRQTLLFSATIPPEIESLCSWVLKNPDIVEIGERRSVAENSDPRFFSGGFGAEV